MVPEAVLNPIADVAPSLKKSWAGLESALSRAVEATARLAAASERLAATQDRMKG